MEISPRSWFQLWGKFPSLEWGLAEGEKLLMNHQSDSLKKGKYTLWLEADALSHPIVCKSVVYSCLRDSVETIEVFSTGKQIYPLMKSARLQVSGKSRKNPWFVCWRKTNVFRLEDSLGRRRDLRRRPGVGWIHGASGYDRSGNPLHGQGRTEDPVPDCWRLVRYFFLSGWGKWKMVFVHVWREKSSAGRQHKWTRFRERKKQACLESGRCREKYCYLWDGYL